MAPIYYPYNFLLCVLQLLHVFWFWTIVRMVKSYIVAGKVTVYSRLFFFNLRTFHWAFTKKYK